MEKLSTNQKYNASVLLNFILNEDSYTVDDSDFCNAVRLCIGKDPIKHSTEYYRDPCLFDFLKNKNAANDVY